MIALVHVFEAENRLTGVIPEELSKMRNLSKLMLGK